MKHANVTFPSDIFYLEHWYISYCLLVSMIYNSLITTDKGSLSVKCIAWHFLSCCIYIYMCVCVCVFLYECVCVHL
jgi:hypothetical protein